MTTDVDEQNYKPGWRPPPPPASWLDADLREIPPVAWFVAAGGLGITLATLLTRWTRRR